MKANLIETFIEEKLKTFREPVRQGVPRGEVIGFGLEKYKASLFIALKALRLKEVAEELDISYGLLRKWRTEYSFNKTIDSHRAEFVDFFIDHLKELRHDLDKRCRERYKMSVEEVARQNVERIPDYHKGSLETFDLHPKLTQAIIRRVLKEKEKDPILPLVASRFYALLELREPPIEDIKKSKMSEYMTVNEILERARMFMNNPTEFSKGEKKDLVIDLEWLQSLTREWLKATKKQKG